MLKSLQVNNIALMDHLSIEFREGFSALTGETGAGKSILIEAIGFVLGDRSSKDIIRTGEQKASAEALFEISGDSPAASFLRENGLYDEEELVVFRDINQAGRSTARINGVLVSVSELKKLGSMLIDLHGQHAHQSLLNEAEHLPLIDACSFNERELSFMREARARTLAIRHDREEMEEKISFRERRIAAIDNELNEINAAGLQAGEEEQLFSRRTFLRNSSLIEDKLNNAYECLFGENGALTLMGEASSALGALTDFGTSFSRYAEQIDGAYYAIEDVAYSIRDEKAELSFSPEELDTLEERLYLIDSLKRKYGASIEDILAYRDEIARERETLIGADNLIQELKDKERLAFSDFKQKAESVSLIRRKTAENLCLSVEKHLHIMGIPNARFHTVFENLPPENLSENGVDEAAFFFSANKGESEKSLSRTASGGEISRVMLAIKATLAATDTIGTLIFDEIDTGISGMIANSVAEEMQNLGRTHQVLCVTHLPQIAAHAEYQYYIYKEDVDGKTISRTCLLDESERPEELARIMGSAGEEAAIEHAKKLLIASRGKHENK